jgi:phosphomannomutase/phosphoglucomutase
MAKDIKNTAAGVVASKATLHRILLIAVLTITLPVLLGFGYLALLRDTGLQDRHTRAAVNIIASEQARALAQVAADLRQRLQQVADSALGQQLLVAEEATVAPLERQILRLFPEFSEVRALLLSDLGTASLSGSSHQLRNHIELDLVRRATAGDPSQPETYRAEGQIYTSMAQLVRADDQPGQQIVILGTFDKALIPRWLALADPANGQVTLQQSHVENGVELITVGSAEAQGEAYRVVFTVPDTSWQLAFTPSHALIAQFHISRLPVLLLLALILLGITGGLLLLAARIPGLLTKDVERIMRGAGLRGQVQLHLPHLVPLGEHLRELLVEHKGHAPLDEDEDEDEDKPEQPRNSQSDNHLMHPLFQRTPLVEDEPDHASADTHVDLENADLSHDPVINPEEFLPAQIFRAYDIRGQAERELGDTTVSLIGRALGTIAADNKESALIVGCDGRTSSPRIKAALIKALLSTGRDVIDIGVVPTPLLYFATRTLQTRSGVMVTGSHNPASYNGLKIVLRNAPSTTGLMQRLRETALAGDFREGRGKASKADPLPAYLEEIISDITLPAPLKVVVDAGNGATSDIAPQLFAELGCDVLQLYCEIDGRFPNRSPDTSREENLSDLAAAVRHNHADLGVAFDGDGDRIAVVTGSGRILRTDQLMMLYVEDVVSRNPGTDVVFDVKCSRNLGQLIVEHGGRPVLSKTGHAFMREKMLETGAMLGGEFSGHIFFGERWYGFDDGMYAAVRLAEILSNQNQTLDDMLDALPQSANTPEILIPVPDDDKFALVQQLVDGAYFPEGKVNTLDGLRVDFNDGWGLVRASNTSAALTARFEASTEQRLRAIMTDFRDQMAVVSPQLSLPE